MSSRNENVVHLSINEFFGGQKFFFYIFVYDIKIYSAKISWAPWNTVYVGFEVESW